MKKRWLIGLVLMFGCTSVQVQEEIQQAESKPEVYEYEPQEWNFHYEQLDTAMQSSYDLLYAGMDTYADEIVLQDVDEEQMQLLFRSILEDHPELFYVHTQYQYRVYADGSLSFYPAYDFDEEERDSMLQQMNALSEEIVAKAPDEEEERAAYLYAYVIEHMAYANNERDQQMDSFFFQGESVCAGYAKAYQYLMQKAGLRCTTISGEWIDDSLVQGDNSRAHAWNLVYLDDDWFYVDTTSGDIIDYGPHTCYQFFLLSTQEAQPIYAPSIEVPSTKAPEKNYFQKHHLYLEKYDEEVLQCSIKRMKEQGDGVIELRTKPDEVNALKAQLLENNRIFHLLAQQGIYADTLGYAQFDALGSLEFYLDE